jgi:hypothetical protein
MPFFCVLSYWVATLAYFLLSGLSVICSRLFRQVCLCSVNCTVCIVRCLHLCACITHCLQIVRLYSITLFVVLTVPLLRYYFWHKSLSDCVLVGMKNCICVTMNNLWSCRDENCIGVSMDKLWSCRDENCIGVSMDKLWSCRDEKLYRRIYEQTVVL